MRPMTAKLRPVQSQKLLQTPSSLDAIDKASDPKQSKVNDDQRTQNFSPNSSSLQPESKTAQSTQALLRPRSSYLGNPQRPINYESRVFTTDLISIDKQLDDVEEIILKYNKRPRSTDKKVRIDIDLHQKYIQEQAYDENQSKKMSPSRLHQDSQFYKSIDRDSAMLQRISMASTKYTSAVRYPGFNSEGMLSRLQSAKSTTQIGSPSSRNPKSGVLSSLMSQKSTQAKPVKNAKENKILLQQSSKSQKNFNILDYQNFFAKNQADSFGIAQCVITGTKMQTKARQELKKQVQTSAEQNIQTEEADTLMDEDSVLKMFDNQNEADDQQTSYKPSNLIYQGAHVRVYAPPKEIVNRGRPMSARPTQVQEIQKRIQSAQPQLNTNDFQPIVENIDQSQATSKKEEESLNFQPESQKEQPLIKTRIYDHSKMNSQLKNDEQLHRSIFREKKQKIMELDDFLKLVLHEHQLEKHQDNQKQIDQTFNKFNITQEDFNNDQKLASLIESMKGSLVSQNTDKSKKDSEDSQIQSTGLRLRRLTAKFGPKIDLVSHGFQHFKVTDIEQFFDPMRLKLMVITLNDIPNQHTKSGSDAFFVKGYKLQYMNDYQKALNAYEEGIKEYPDSSYNCKFNKAVILFKLGIFKESLNVYRHITKEEPMDKRLLYNKAICEIQNGMFNQCILNIDAYIHDYNERQRKLDLDKKSLEQLPYADKIIFQKPHYIPDNQFLYEIYQIRGVACLRANQVVEASKSFTVAQEFKQLMQQQQQSRNASRRNTIVVDDQQTPEVLCEDYTEITLDRTKSQQINSAQQSIKLEDQKQQSSFRVRPVTAKLIKSQSQRGLQPRLETLEEEHQVESLQQTQSSIAPKLSDKQEDFFSIDAESMMRTLDDYEEEHRMIKREMKQLQKIGAQTKNPLIHINRNLDNYFNKSGIRPHTAKHQTQATQPLYFGNKNMLVTIDKPKGTIAQFLERQQASLPKPLAHKTAAKPVEKDTVQGKVEEKTEKEVAKYHDES